RVLFRSLQGPVEDTVWAAGFDGMHPTIIRTGRYRVQCVGPTAAVLRFPHPRGLGPPGRTLNCRDGPGPKGTGSRSVREAPFRRKFGLYITGRAETHPRHRLRDK